MLPGHIVAGESGTVHILPGANVTLVNLLPTALGSFGVWVQPFLASNLKRC